MLQDNFAVTTNANLSFQKRPINDILKDAKKIDVDLSSKEILDWLIGNVENFIDNHAKMFKLDLIMDGIKELSESKKLQDLYRAIPDDEGLSEEEVDRAQKCRRTLDEITSKVYDKMAKDKKKLEELFGRMIFFYEKVIPSAENRKQALRIDAELKELFLQKEKLDERGQKRIQKKIVEKIKEGENLIQFERLEGAVNITKFEYEAFSVGLMVKAKDDQDSEVKRVVKETVIPEGFTLWLELSYKPKQRPTVMF